MTEFNYEKFTNDMTYAIDSIKQNIGINSSILTKINEDNKETTENSLEIQDSIERSCLCLANVYLSISKIYENLGKNNSSQSQLKQDVKKNNNKLDHLFN